MARRSPRDSAPTAATNADRLPKSNNLRDEEDDAAESWVFARRTSLPLPSPTPLEEDLEEDWATLRDDENDDDDSRSSSSTRWPRVGPTAAALPARRGRHDVGEATVRVSGAEYARIVILSSFCAAARPSPLGRKGNVCDALCVLTREQLFFFFFAKKQQ